MIKASENSALIGTHVARWGSYEIPTIEGRVVAVIGEFVCVDYAHQISPLYDYIKCKTRAMIPLQTFVKEWTLYPEAPPKAERKLAREAEGDEFESVATRNGLRHEPVKIYLELNDADYAADAKRQEAYNARKLQEQRQEQDRLNQIRWAVDSLDPRNDLHWKKSGEPSALGLYNTTGFIGFSRKEIEAACQGITRDSARLMARIRRAVKKLDSDNPEHWCANGSPNIAALEYLSGVVGITSSEMDSVLPGWNNRELPPDTATQKIIDGLKVLNPENDEHWTDEGLPKVASVEDAGGIVGVTRKDIESAYPGWTRSIAMEAAVAAL